MSAGEHEVEGFCRVEHPRLVQSMTLYTGDADLAAELAQEALARAHRDWARVGAMDAPGGWTHRVAVNLANSHLRRKRLERAARQRAVARQPLFWHDRRPSEDFDGLLREVASLPRRQREAVALRFLLDLSIEQTATRMDCAPGTVRALTAQAIATLRTRPLLAGLLSDQPAGAAGPTPERSDG